MAHHAGQADHDAAAAGAQLEGQVNVLPAVEKLFVESACGAEILGAQKAAGGGDGEHVARPPPSARQGRDVRQFGRRGDLDAGMIDRSVRHAMLHIADEGNGGSADEERKHRFEPAGVSSRSLLSRARNSPRASAAPRLQAAAKPRLLSFSTTWQPG